MAKVALTERQKDFQRLSHNLRVIRGGRGSQEMANILGCARTTYYRKEQNPETLTYEEIRRLCDFTGVKLADFLCGTLQIWSVAV